MNINVWSFIISLFCIPLLFIATLYIKIDIFGIHPLNIVLIITIITFVLGVLGLKDVNNWKAMARSIVTICLTISFSVLLLYIILIGDLLS